MTEVIEKNESETRLFFKVTPESVQQLFENLDKTVDVLRDQGFELPDEVGVVIKQAKRDTYMEMVGLEVILPSEEIAGAFMLNIKSV